MCGPFAAAAIEQTDVIAGLHAQRSAYMLAGTSLQLQGLASSDVLPGVDPGNSHDDTRLPLKTQIIIDFARWLYLIHGVEVNARGAVIQQGLA